MSLQNKFADFSKIKLTHENYSEEQRKAYKDEGYVFCGCSKSKI